MSTLLPIFTHAEASIVQEDPDDAGAHEEVKLQSYSQRGYVSIQPTLELLTEELRGNHRCAEASLKVKDYEVAQGFIARANSHRTAIELLNKIAEAIDRAHG